MRIIHRGLPLLKSVRRGAQSAAVCAMCFLLSGCYDEMERYTSVTNPTSGSPKNGAALIAQYGCGSCHIVPGVAGANGLVGPPLTHMGRRVYIAGMLRNSPENMIAWLENPQAIVAGNVMPRMGLNRNQAQDIAAYLDTLR